MKSQSIPYVSKLESLSRKSMRMLKSLNTLLFSKLSNRTGVLLRNIMSFSSHAIFPMSSEARRRDTTYQSTRLTKRNYMLKGSSTAFGNQNDPEKEQYDLASIEHTLKNLDKDLYAPFVMHLEGYKGYEIAQYLQISEKSVKKRINSVIKQLDKGLNAE